MDPVRPVTSPFPSPQALHNSRESEMGWPGDWPRPTPRRPRRTDPRVQGCHGITRIGFPAPTGSAGDAVAGASAGGASGAPVAVLGRDRSRPADRGGGRRGGGVDAGCVPVVPRGWWDVIDQQGPALGAIPLVRRARRDRASPGARLWRAGDGASARSFSVDDFAGAAAQRRHPRWAARLPGQHRPVARRPARAAAEGRRSW